MKKTAARWLLLCACVLLVVHAVVKLIDGNIIIVGVCLVGVALLLMTLSSRDLARR